MNPMQCPVFFEQFELQAERLPDAVAVESPSQSLSYAQLQAESNRMANLLARRGVSPRQGTVVALHLDPGPAYVAALLGVAKAGAVFMPLPPDLPPARAESVLQKAHCTVAVSTVEHAAGLQDSFPGMTVLTAPDWAEESGGTRPGITIGPTDPCYVVYTSGSTGEPKAILGSHRGLSHFLRWELGELALDEGVRGSWLAPTTFDVSLRDMLVPLMAGGAVCYPGEDVRTQPHRLIDWLASRRISLVHCVPTLLRLMNRALAHDPLDGLETQGRPRTPALLPDLRHLLVAGEPLLACDVAAWRRITMSAAQVLNLYGPSETTLAKVFFRVGEVSEDDRSVLPIGSPLPNTSVFLLQDGRACASGEIGEICISTPYRSLGYLHDEALTAAAFVVNPLTRDPADVIYRTGDLGRLLPDGTVMCLGRQDGQVKINGVRIELAEVESVLAKFPGINQCACALHSQRSDAQPLLVAYFTVRDDHAEAIEVSTIQTHLARFLPSAMMPHRLMRLTSIPTTVSGKVNRKALPKPSEVVYGQAAYEKAQTPTEAQLARIWGELMELEVVGVTTPFHLLGGDSLRAIRCLMLVYQECGVEVSLKDFFRLGTVRQIAALIDELKSAGGEGQIPRVPDQPRYASSAAQDRLWRLDRMGIAPTAYNLPAAFEVRGPLDVQRLGQALLRVMQRHESLRTVFEEVDGHATQRVLAEVPVPLVYHDLRKERQPQECALAFAQEDESTAFDLRDGPLLRLTVLRCPDLATQAGPTDTVCARHVVLFNIHHIISDVWSLGVLAREVSQAYDALASGQEPAWKPLTLQQRDVLAWQARRLADGHLAEDRAYWMQQFASPPMPLNLPSDRPRPATQTFRGSTRRHRMSPQTASSLLQLATEQGCTQFALLQALVKVLLHRYSGQTDLVVGSPVAGRHHPDLQDQIGYYVNVLPLRDRVDGNRLLREFIGESACRVQEAIAHQSWPFDRLVAELDLPRDMSRSPLFDVMVVVDTFDPVSLELEGHEVRAWGHENAWNFSRFDLVFHFQTEASELVLDLNFNSDLFDAGRIDRICAQFELLASAAARNPDLPLGDLPILTVQELSAIERWSAGPELARPALSISALMEQVGDQHGPQPALVWPQGHWSHAQLLAKTNALAVALWTQAGWAPGQVVAVWAHRSPLGVLSMLAVMRAGGVYLPLDPAYPPARLKRLLQISGCSWLIAEDPQELEQARAAVGDAVCERDGAARPIDVHSLLSAPTADGIAATAIPLPLADDPAYLIFTSGSTGMPKGVMCRHGALVNMSLGQIEILGLQPDDRVLQFASPAFDASLANVFMAMFSGAAVVLPPVRALESTAEFLHTLSDTRSTVVTLPPSFLRAMEHLPMPGLRVLITAGEAALVSDLVHYARHHAVFNAYGPTEATVCATMHRVCEHDGQRPSVPIGLPLPNVQLQVVDARGQAVPIGVPGRLMIGGAGVALGYHGDADLTAARFPVLGPHGQRFYDSGDRVAWLPDGHLDFIGRMDDQVKVAGHRIEIAEVEQALRECPDVADCAVVAVNRQDGTTALAAYYCLQAKPQLWPSVAEFYVYDDVVYASMAQDEARNDRYKAAFARHLRGKVVLDIGTGPVAILSQLAIQAGAAHVYAVDLLPATAEKARRTVQRLGLSDRITVLQGDARTVELPVPADICISEIVGAIGGSEGSAEIINQARRLLRDPSQMLPKRSVTRLCAIHLAEGSFDWGFPEVAAHYVERIFEEVGRPFDLRLCIKNLPPHAIVSDSGVLEDLDYTRHVPLRSTHEERLTVRQDGPINGLLAWLQLHVDDDQVVDILENPASWIPVFIPLDVGMLHARAGDLLELTIDRRLADNRLNPDFLVHGRLMRHGREVQAFRADSLHYGQGFRSNPFHARLFREGPTVARSQETGALDLRAALSHLLPGYAVPAYWKALDRLPTTVAGKVDRQALPHPQSDVPSDADPGASGPPLESMIAQVWATALGRSSVSRDDDFFLLGGDSIRAIQIVSRLRRLGILAEVQDLFQNPTVGRLAATVQTQGVWASQDPVQGEMAFTPMQRWLLAMSSETPHRFHQAVLLRSPEALNHAAVRSAVLALWEHHDGLRQQVDGDKTWIAPAGAPEGAVGPVVIWQDQGSRSTDEARSLDEGAEALYGALRLAPGCPLFGVLHLRGNGRDVVLLAAHHFVVDRVSWDFLLEDFEAAYSAAVSGASALLPLKSSSIPAYCTWLHTLGEGQELESMQRHVQELESRPQQVWGHAQSGAGGTPHLVTLELDGPSTSSLAAACSHHRVSLEATLLAALAIATEDRLGMVSALVDLESHGRSVPPALSARRPHLDLSRTVGWFTTFAPLELPATGGLTLMEAAAAVQARQQAVPDSGWTYPLVRWAMPASPLARPGSTKVTPGCARMGFNHLGRLDGSTASGRFDVDWDAPGQTVGPEAASPHVLSLLTLERDGRLEMSVTGDMAVLSGEQVQSLAACVLDILQQAASGWSSRPDGSASAAPAYSGDVSSAELDSLLGLD